jgi:hypothetical protein
MNAADLRGREEHVLRFFPDEKPLDRGLVGQVELGVAPGNEVGEAVAVKPSDERGAHKPVMAGDEDF